MVNKKAISPLIATLLLIAFTVALGVMIMNFGKTIIPDYGGCDSIKIEVDSAPNSICYIPDKSELAFTLINTGKTDVSSIVLKTKNLKAQGADRIKEFPLIDSDIPNGGYLAKTYPYSKPTSFEIEFIPKILVKNTEQLCPAQSVKVSSLNDCT